MAKVGSDHCRASFAFERSHQIACAAAEIEHADLGVSQNGAKDAGSACPPATVQAEAQQMVEAIVGGGDGVEKFADVSRGGGFVGFVRNARAWRGSVARSD